MLGAMLMFLAKVLYMLFLCVYCVGFMCGTNVLDKDGVSAAVVVAEMATHLAAQGITLKQQLIKIYEM